MELNEQPQFREFLSTGGPSPESFARIEALERWNAQDHDGITLYDFGAGVTVMPVPDFSTKEGTYKTSLCCYLVDGQFDGDFTNDLLDGQIHSRPNGKILIVEFENETPEEVLTALDAAKDKLISAR